VIIVYFKENCTGLKGNSEFLPKREEYLLPTFWLKKVLPSYSKPVPTGLQTRFPTIPLGAGPVRVILVDGLVIDKICPKYYVIESFYRRKTNGRIFIVNIVEMYCSWMGFLFEEKLIIRYQITLSNIFIDVARSTIKVLKYHSLDKCTL